MADVFDCIIESADQSFYNGSAKKIDLPTFDGNICILPDHINYLSHLKSGEIIIDNTKKISVEKGYISFIDNICRIWLF